MIAFFLGLVREALLRTFKFSAPTSDFYIFWGKFILIAAGLFFFADKVAVKEMAKAAEQGLNNTFIVYYVLSIPLKLLGVSPRGAIVTINFILIYALAIYVYNFSLAGLAKRRRSQVIYILLMLYPDIIYFNFFSLRDLGLGVMMAFFVISLVNSRFKTAFLWAVVMFLTRPELVLWMVLVFGLLGVSRIKKDWVGSGFILICGLTVVWAFNFVLNWFLEFNHWSTGLNSITESVNFLMERRYERQFSDTDGSGNTSPTLSPEVFYEASLLLRIALQALSFIYISTVPSSMLPVIGVVTGIPPLIIMWRLFSSRIAGGRWLLVCALSSFLIYSPFLVNGGNAFRLRIAMIIICLTSCAILLRWQSHVEKMRHYEHISVDDAR